MTLPATDPSYPNKLARGSRTPNYSRVIKYLDDIQERAHPSRKAKAKVNLFFILVIVAISIGVAIGSILSRGIN
jgi:hypothetical protein